MVLLKIIYVSTKMNPKDCIGSHQQVTIHPSVAMYPCKQQGCNKLLMHEVVHLSDNLKHDAHIVKNFRARTVEEKHKLHSIGNTGSPSLLYLHNLLVVKATSMEENVIILYVQIVGKDMT